MFCEVISISHLLHRAHRELTLDNTGIFSKCDIRASPSHDVIYAGGECTVLMVGCLSLIAMISHDKEENFFITQVFLTPILLQRKL
jgi:hypothetical protein